MVLIQNINILKLIVNIKTTHQLLIINSHLTTNNQQLFLSLRLTKQRLIKHEH